MANSVVTLEEALNIVKSNVKPLQKEVVLLENLLHRVLACNILSKCDMPPFNKSAMDGFACKSNEVGKQLQVIGESAAKSTSSQTIQEGQAIRIMTGAQVPFGADIVVMKEVALEKNGFVSFNGDPKNPNICYKGEDVKINDLVLAEGTLCTSRHIAVLASAGYNQAEVYKQPKVGIFATGNELVEPGNNLLNGQIYNANGHQLMAECQNIGLTPTYLGILPDSYDGVKTKIEEATNFYDAIILSGGVSVGDYDFIPFAIKALNFSIKFDTMATKPGKHTVFATNGTKYILGLPGNPVSTLVQFELIGKTLLNKLQGLSRENNLLKTAIASNYKRKLADKLELLPACLNNYGHLELLAYHGSAHIAALTKATFLAQIPIGITSLNKGDSIDARPLQ